MKNRIIKITSTVLTVLILFSAIVCVIPQKAAALHSSVSSTAEVKTQSDIEKIVGDMQKYNYATAEECLTYELSQGYLDGVTAADRRYSIYVNRYTGMMFYRNNLTGQILTSNPYQYYINYVDENQNTPISQSDRYDLSSQIVINFSQSDTRGEEKVYYSTEWAALYSQITTDFIENGIRVSYTLGDTTARFFLPGRITVESFETYFLKPLIERFYELLKEATAGTENASKVFNFLDEEAAAENKYQTYVDGCLNLGSTKVTRTYGEGDSATRVTIEQGLARYLTNMLRYAGGTAQYDAIIELNTDINTLLANYSQINVKAYENQPARQSVYDKMVADYYSDKTLEISSTYEPFYLYSKAETGTASIFRVDAALMRKCADLYADEHDQVTFTFEDLRNEEKHLGYVDKTPQKPVFRCALEYTFASDGSDALLVRLPANSISFDESKYTLQSITPLKYFGAGNINENGYIFFPDGSGTIIDFDDFRSFRGSITGSGEVYGADYCYSTITGVHHEQITLPVYGVVGVTGTNAASAAFTASTESDLGYFAILEEGASLASLNYRTGGTAHKFAAAYAYFNPYPSDMVDLSTAGGSSSYNIVSDSKYNGSYVTRYVMLTDDTIGTAVYGANGYYPTSYTGMAAYYREYLRGTGVLGALSSVEENLPLYIEALGSMEITDKFLTFPVTKKIALTSFENIQTMYGELSERGVSNINFRLTGFANDGMYYTYPTRLRWERVVGGKKGLRGLISAAGEISAQEGKNFQIFPEFDFLYIHNQALFDGITLKGNVSRRVDNRYASRRVEEEQLSAERTLVISADVLDKLYTKFSKRYAKYDLKNLSVSTLGAELNSNFDPDQSVNRDDAQNYVSALLKRMNADDGYNLMADAGNVYAVRYIKHLLNVSTDSSHFRYSSYPVPFIGMILHGSVSYAGSPINYAGTIEYELLRAIESGASLYYILCYDNTSYMKDDEALSEYYGVDYATWRDEIVSTYTELNALLKDLQTWQITGHEVILGERVIEARETAANYCLLKDEFLQNLADQIDAAINEKYEAMRAAGNIKKLGIEIDKDALVDLLAEKLELDAGQKEEILTGDADFNAGFDALIAEYKKEYQQDEEILTFGDEDFTYSSKYSYVTVSDATADDYVMTEYTSDLNNIVLVTYSNGSDSVRFILNYNIYDIVVRLDGVTYEIPMFGYAKVQ